MSDPKVNESNSDQVSNVNVDDLLSDIKQMADHVEDLIGKQEEPALPPDPAPSGADPSVPAGEETGTATVETNPETDPPQDLAQMDQLACETAEEVGQEMQAQPTEEAIPGSEASEPEGGSSTTESDSTEEIQVDEHTDKLAEDEINEALGKLDQKESKPAAKAAPPTTDSLLQINDLPSPFRILLKVLLILDRPFIWLPRPIKDVIGYIGLATFLLAVMLWVTVFLMGKK